MRVGYHTGGLLLHETNTAIEELARLGYDTVVIRPHAGTLDFSQPRFAETCVRLADTIQRHEVTCIFDLDGYFLSCPHKRTMTGLIEDPESSKNAIEQLTRWFPVAQELGASTLTFSSGRVPESDADTLEQQLDRITASVDVMLEAAGQFDLQLAIRPVHGDCIGSIVRYEQLQQWLGRDGLGLAADVGEMLLESEIPIVDRLERHLETLCCVYLCDRISGEQTGHQDVRIGQGDVSVQRVIESLERLDFAGTAIIRVEGHSEWGLQPAREAIGLFEK